MAPESEGQPAAAPSITAIEVAGFKSFATRQRIDIRPLTVLAGTNSSGKSSMMQALLLLKQTLEASYDPGPLLLNGPNVRFTSADQVFFKGLGLTTAHRWAVRMESGDGGHAEVVFGQASNRKLEIEQCTYAVLGSEPRTLSPGSPDIRVALPNGPEAIIRVTRLRCFLGYAYGSEFDNEALSYFQHALSRPFRSYLQSIIHLSGLRGNPERAYPVTAFGPQFPGTFESYTATIVSSWTRGSPELVAELAADLIVLGLTSEVTAVELDDTRVELRVGRLPKPKQGDTRDLVNIADVGFGVSQTLPLLVALLVARPGQLVFVEQPEIHLHPRAQFALAIPLAKAAMRGVHVVVETHSSLLLLGIQAQVAEQLLAADRVRLHWFTRSDTDGATTVTNAGLDAAGRFGDWPEDFDDVSLHAQARYLDAAEAVLANGAK